MPPESMPQPHLTQAFKDKPQFCKVEALGRIEHTHKERKLPDFRFDMADSKLMKILKRQVAALDNKKSWDFRLNCMPNTDTETRMIPPPQYARQDVPFRWTNDGSPYQEPTPDAQEPPVISTRPKSHEFDILKVRHDVRTVPHLPKAEWPAEKTLKPEVQHLIFRLRALLQQQAVVTKRLLQDRLQPKVASELKVATRYCGYYFSSGPWRDAIVRYGYDPRRSPADMFLQTVSFQKDRTETSGPRSWAKPLEANRPKVFDGVSPPVEPRTYQVYEITDRLLRDIIESEPPRTTLAVSQISSPEDPLSLTFRAG